MYGKPNAISRVLDIGGIFMGLPKKGVLMLRNT
jgi:hypothetical protein